jgi:DNA polymerase II large subunit
VKEDLALALERLGMRKAPEVVKGVQSLMSADKVPEPLEKGVLRAFHGVYVFKDGTVRFDMTDAPLTHFFPRDIGTSVSVLRRLGYVSDAYGARLERDDQLVELRAQDVVVSAACGDYLLRAARFVDDLLVKFYGLDAYYAAERKEDLVGRLLVGLAPHTSAGVLGRLIGFTRAQVVWAHPFFHAGKRRNADGDEDAVLLLMDCFLNFSRRFVPDRRGGLMDLPLVLTTRLNPQEIDKEAHNLDVGWHYPKAFYEATMRHAHPKEWVQSMDLVEGRLGTPRQYEGFGATHVGTSIELGPASSSYKTLGVMLDKMEAQLALADRIRAVDAVDVADRVISTHLLPDLQGNLKAFTRQKVRCTKCGAKYRRPPLAGRCTNGVAADKVCGNALTLTVHEKSVKKYLAVVTQLDERYALPEYTRQRIELTRRYIDDAFAPDPLRKTRLADFV